MMCASYRLRLYEILRMPKGRIQLVKKKNETENIDSDFIMVSVNIIREL